MILQSLKEYYDRKAADPESQMAAPGWEWKEIPFLAVLDVRGCFVRLEDTREGEGRDRRAHRFLVPSLGEKKGNGIKANLLWENIEYMFGVPVQTKAKPHPDPERVRRQHQAFCERIATITGNGPAASALRSFAANLDVEAVKRDALWRTMLSVNQNTLLSLQAKGPLTDDPEVREWVDTSGSPSGALGVCLVSGDYDTIVKLEPPIKGVSGGDGKAERSFVSFNLDAFLSYGKTKNYTAPIGRRGSSAYTAALNHLLRRGSPQRMQVGDATTVFWAAKRISNPESDLEKHWTDFFGEPPKDNPDQGVRAVESLFRAVKTGAFAAEGKDNRFYVLGLAPNSSRISVRFWVVDTVEGMSAKICQHFLDTEIAPPHDLPKWQSLNAFLAATANETKFDNSKANLVKHRGRCYDVKPNLEGDTMRAILEGLPYPQTLLHGALRRIRAEQAKKDKRTGKQLPNVTYERAALIKACINRSIRKNHPTGERELIVSLDESNTNIGYRLGRLFATLERIQIRAHTSGGGKEPNSTIRDKYYGSASGTPRAVFSTLIRLSKHHLSKIENVRERIKFEKLIGQIMDGIPPYFPGHLSLDDQGRFAIGYYHQMQASSQRVTPVRADN